VAQPAFRPASRAPLLPDHAPLLPDHAPDRLSVVSPTWIWMQIAIVVFVVIGMIIAITKLV
jgi:hypothetical protein